MTSQLMTGQFNSQLNNWFSSVSAYADMSPDLSIRRQVNERMKARTRRVLSRSEWCQLFATPASTRPVLSFIYQYFGQYSGIEFGRVRPSDRLNCDLHFPLVCWFDWSLTFCEDFFQQFNLDLSDRFDEAAFETIGELVNFVVEQTSVEQISVEQMAS